MTHLETSFPCLIWRRHSHDSSGDVIHMLIRRHHSHDSSGDRIQSTRGASSCSGAAESSGAANNTVPVVPIPVGQQVPMLAMSRMHLARTPYMGEPRRRGVGGGGGGHALAIFTLCGRRRSATCACGGAVARVTLAQLGGSRFARYLASETLGRDPPSALRTASFHRYLMGVRCSC
jgi:hypothetical protein